MAKKVNFYDTQYSNFKSDLYSQIRSEVYDLDFGQNGWITADEQDEFLKKLNLNSNKSLLDVACGSGGPTIRIAEITNCNVTGIDIHENGIHTANEFAKNKNLESNVQFIKADGAKTLPFSNDTFDVIICIDAINHLPEREKVLKEWRRILKPKGLLFFIDPIVVTGMLSNEQIEERASIGYFLFVTDSFNENLLSKTGFNLLGKGDHTQNMKNVAEAFHKAREKRREELIKIEGEETFIGQQNFFQICSELAKDKSLSRLSYLAQK